MSSVLLIGCGNMGFAMLRAWTENRRDLDFYVIEPVESLRARAAQTGAQTLADPDALPVEFDPILIVIAVKPQMIADILPAYVPWAGGRSCFVSIAAGTTIDALAAILPGSTPIIRCMPNTPAAIGAGMTVCCPNSHASPAACALTGTLMSASGEVAWIEDESLMDAVTAISGSGPAYVFHFIETLICAGEKLGLGAELASRLAIQTVLGASRLVAESKQPPAILREQVTSPGGTTAAALHVLMAEDGLGPLMDNATRAARDRGRALGQKQ